MLRLPSIDLPDQAAARLWEYQGEVDAESTYSKQLEAAKTLFSSRNRASNRTFKVVRAKLHEMCGGVRRCGYCEDSMADEVEHIWPKSLYPERVFSWQNYLYACGPCNGPKNNDFRVFARGTGDTVDVTRKRNDPVVPPIKGDPVLIDPRIDDPLVHLELDIPATFFFVPLEDDDGRSLERAEYTIELLQLNGRGLDEARRVMYRAYRSTLYEYADRRENGEAIADLAHLRDAVRKYSHPTVWAEMKRQWELHKELRALFERAPEALDW